MSRILIVDDEPQILRALRINLRARQYDVHTAAAGATALKSAAEHHPDLVGLDLGLPDLDGVDVIRGLRGWTKVPIIVLSARQASNEKVAALDRAVDPHEVLVDHAARADREMTDLGVPHLPAREADRLAGSFERRVRVAAPQLVEDRCVS